MAQMAMGRGRLWRYNYKILLGGGYWVLVLPVAASQVVTLWMMAMQSEFNQTMATHIAEMMTPIISAFLVAHSLAPEYRSGVGAVLACKPVSLHRVVTMRVGLAILAGFVLTTATLVVCSVGLAPVDVLQPLAAALPSVWFLSMLALTFATLFRNAMAGFAVAAGIWALDLAVGYAIHPFLSLQGLHALQENDPLAVLWIKGKIVLAVAGTLLLGVQWRLIPRICRAAERRDVVRIAGATAAVLLVYCLSGAASTISYAYEHRANLPMMDVVWLRRQLKIYGPIPVARFFGQPFAVYVAEPAAASAANTSGATVRLRELEKAVARWPNSMWADGIAFTLGLEREQIEPERVTVDFLRVADRFGASPFAPKALARIIRNEKGTATDQERLQAARRLLADYPKAPEAERGADVLKENFPGTVRAEEMLAAATTAAGVCPRQRRPAWLLVRAERLVELGKSSEAIAAAREAMTYGKELAAEANSHEPGGNELQPHRPTIDRAIVGADQLLGRLGAR